MLYDLATDELHSEMGNGLCDVEPTPTAIAALLELRLLYRVTAFFLILVIIRVFHIRSRMWLGSLIARQCFMRGWDDMLACRFLP